MGAERDESTLARSDKFDGHRQVIGVSGIESGGARS